MFTLPDDFPLRDDLRPEDPPWRWVEVLSTALKRLLAQTEPQRSADVPSGFYIEGDVHIDPSVKLPPFGYAKGPAWIGPGCELRPGVFVRGNVFVLSNSVLGNSCEYKNCLLLDGVETPHYNYVGDSILGNRAHLGAGVICANLRLDRQEVLVWQPDGSRLKSGLRKLGAMLADDAEAGCNAVLQPGTMLDREAVVMSGVAFSGYLGPKQMAVSQQRIRRIPRPDR